jgi:glycosyltransferase involved in cell wall biosynthesis
MEYSDHDKGPRRLPFSHLIKLIVPLLFIPVSGLILKLNPWFSLLSLICGVGMFVMLTRNSPLRGVFSLKITLTCLAVQGMTLLLMKSFSDFHSFSQLGFSRDLPGSREFSMITNNARELKTLSVILPCANEGIFAVNTARSIGEKTPKDVLHEIIVVDDGSTPPLENFFKENGADVLENYPVKFVRHETFTGLINAKKQGGDRATGDVLAFLDCHVAPRDYESDHTWAHGIMQRISGNYKRVVVPSITDLDPHTWTEIGKPAGIAKCYLSLDVDFRWFDSENDFVPIMSGGLLAMSRQWWIETGGYDETMVGWGGENIDQSLRIWLCGGEIVQATDSHVAHMWRLPNNDFTKAKYKVPEGSVATNRYRAALAWFDDYIEKVHAFSTFSKFVHPTSAPLPNVDSILEVKNRLQCQPFQWFLERFPDVYFAANVLADEIFWIRDEYTNTCLARRTTGRREEHDVVAVSCSTEDSMQLWHRGNRDGDKCCSGLRSYDSMYCLSGGSGGEVAATECTTIGRNMAQAVKITEDYSIMFTRFNTCVSVGASSKEVVVQSPCDTPNMLNRFSVEQVSNPDGLGAGSHHIVEAKSGKCLTAFSPVAAETDKGNIELETCSSRSMHQMFKLVDINFAPGYVQIRTWENLCLDAADGQRLLAYQCYDESVKNENQIFQFEENTQFIKSKRHPVCVSVPDSSLQVNAGKVPVKISGCTVWDDKIKEEQRFVKIPSKSRSGLFLVKSGDWCLKADDDVIVVVKCPNDASGESDDMIWKFGKLNRLSNLQHHKCIDGNDAKTPILYPCYDSENDNQEWSDPEDGGLVKNARAKLCLDFNPTPERQVSVTRNCKTDAKWTAHNPHESLETRIYKQTKLKESAPIHG